MLRRMRRRFARSIRRRSRYPRGTFGATIVRWGSDTVRNADAALDDHTDSSAITDDSGSKHSGANRVTDLTLA